MNDPQQIRRRILVGLGCTVQARREGLHGRLGRISPANLVALMRRRTKAWGKVLIEDASLLSPEPGLLGLVAEDHDDHSVPLLDALVVSGHLDSSPPARLELGRAAVAA